MDVRGRTWGSPSWGSEKERGFLTPASGAVSRGNFSPCEFSCRNTSLLPSSPAFSSHLVPFPRQTQGMAQKVLWNQRPFACWHRVPEAKGWHDGGACPFGGHDPGRGGVPQEPLALETAPQEAACIPRRVLVTSAKAGRWH